MKLLLCVVNAHNVYFWPSVSLTASGKEPQMEAEGQADELNSPADLVLNNLINTANQ